MWIETLHYSDSLPIRNVTPHVGVWIETFQTSQERKQRHVTPHVGVWIETCFQSCRT